MGSIAIIFVQFPIEGSLSLITTCLTYILMLRYLVVQSDRHIDIIRKRLVVYITVGTPREMQHVLRSKLKMITRARKIAGFYLVWALVIQLTRLILMVFWIELETFLGDFMFSALVLFVFRPRNDKIIKIYLGEEGRMVVPIEQTPSTRPRAVAQETQGSIFRFEAILFNNGPKSDQAQMIVGYLQN